MDRDEDFAWLESRVAAHGIALKFLIARLVPDKAKRDEMRDELCGALERQLLEKGDVSEHEHRHRQFLLAEMEVLFDRPTPGAGRNNP